MKWYKRDPSAALEGMTSLTLEECGAYNLVIDAYYARDGHLPDDDFLIARILRCNPRRWRRLKIILFQKKKLTLNEHCLVPSRGIETLLDAQTFSKDQSNRAKQRWNEVKKANEINETPMPLAAVPAMAMQPTTTTTPILESSLGKGREAPKVRVVLPPVVNYRDPGSDYRSPPKAKSDNVLEPVLLTADVIRQVLPKRNRG